MLVWEEEEAVHGGAALTFLLGSQFDILIRLPEALGGQRRVEILPVPYLLLMGSGGVTTAVTIIMTVAAAKGHVCAGEKGKETQTQTS